MNTATADSIRQAIHPSMCSLKVYNEFMERLGRGETTRDENIADHFSVYFLPYNPLTRQVFIVYHKKAGQWISAGGHIDKGEAILRTLERELFEELGVFFKAPSDYKPFLLSITQIKNPKHRCEKHYDFWYGIQTDGSDFVIDPSEFHETRWVTVAEARNLITDPPNLEALDKIEQTVFHKPR